MANESIKRMAAQLDCIKVRALSIASMIQDYNVSDMMDDCKLGELIDSINSDKDVMKIHIEFASDLINWDADA